MVLATAIMSWFKFYLNNLRIAQAMEIDNVFTRGPFLGGVVFFIMSLIFSPLLVPAVIVPSIEKAVFTGLGSVIQADEEFQS